jgi:tRNA A-37 threonylcarbamoyl transferase component Bud32
VVTFPSAVHSEVDALPPGALPVAIGDVLAGKYRVDRVLGVGGMGVVVAAVHLQLDQRVALKFMLPEALAQTTLVERFAREARAAARLRSDHVARVLDVGTLESGSPYMVMEYLEGSDLGTVIERNGRMPIDMAVDCVLQACDAIAEAHSVGIVHRDLKPRNLFLTTRNDGSPLVKVLDFGISKHAAPGDMSLTRSTEVIGSPNYMSPEQLKSAREVDARSDIWALGVILYELLTGQVPFVAESVAQLVALVLMELPRPIESLRAEVPADLKRAIARCLEKDPALRFASIADLALALQPFAPPGARVLASRIARIAPTGRASALALGSTQSAVGVTTADRIGPETRGRSSSPWRILAGVVIAAGAAATLAGVVIVTRSGRANTVTGATTGGPAVATSETVPVAAPGPSLVPPPLATLEPATTRAAPAPSVLYDAGAPLVRSGGPAPAQRAFPAGGSTTRRGAGRDEPQGAPSAPPASSEEAPRYRTTW